MIAAVILTALFMQGESLGIQPVSSSPEYESRLFDDSRVHTIDLQIDDWNTFLEAAPSETYFQCDVVIDGERFPDTGLRAKGNNSRRLVEEYGPDSFIVQEDGRLLFSFGFTDEESILGWILSFRGGAKLLEPEPLRGKLSKLGRKLEEQYSDS